MKQIKTLLLCFSAALLVCVPAFAETCPEAGSLSYAATLVGSQFGGQGASNGFGTGFITINPTLGTATVNLNTTGLGDITSAGLFNNNTSSSALPFTNSNVTFTNGNLSTTIPISSTLMNQILANPNSFSFNVATGAFPNGALVGTLTPLQSFGGTFAGSNVIGTTGVSNGGGSFTAQIVPNASGTGSLLNYSFTPTGIGNDITSLQLNQGIAGSNGSSFVTLSNGGSLTNGQLTGSVPLTTAQAQSLLMNPSGFNVVANTAQFPNGAVRAQFGAVQNELWIPVAGNVPGAFGTQWQTDLRIFNTSAGAPATVTVQWLPSGNTPNVTSSGTLNTANVATITVPARGVNAAANATASILNITNGTGAIRLISDQPIVATARIYNNQTARGIGTFGQTIQALTRCEAVARGVLVGLSTGIAGNNPSVTGRTNLGFVNPNGTPVTVNITLNNANGIVGGQQSLTLQPYSQFQIPLAGTNGVFANQSADIQNAAVSFLASAPIFGYASVVDNVSGDADFLIAKPDNGAIGSVGQGDIAGIVTALNQGEITEGQVAAQRATIPAVQQFALRMVNEHTQALAQAQATFASSGISASSTGTATFLQQQTSQNVATLNATPNGTTFDRQYMQDQVNMHQMALALFDQVLIPSATVAQVQSLLQQQRAAVAEHLVDARAILASLP